MKHRSTKFLGIFAFIATIFTLSCTEYNTTDAEDIENEIFAEWMAKYHPDLLANYQEDGAYYIDLVTAGDTTGRPISDTSCWVEYDLTGYDLNGNICVTRNDLVAWQQGTYTDYTHYTPYYRFSYDLDDYDDYDDYEDFDLLLECTQLAFTNALPVGDRDDVLLYNGAEFTLYSPSSIISSEGVTGSGGYEGQYTLGTLPFICKIKVVNVVYDPLGQDEEMVNAFVISNGGVTINPDSFNNDYDDEDDEDEATDDGTDDDEDEEEEVEEDDNDPNAWKNATSNVPHVYINTKYTPSDSNTVSGTSFNYINPYTSVVPDSPYYNGIAELDRKIHVALAKRFDDDYYDDGELIGDDGAATIWYICRLLDGFIIDTNIDEVKELIYGSVDSSGSAISYDMTSDEENYILAWFYSIPAMRDGRWCAIVTSSTFAYGSEGVNGDTTTSSSSSYYDYYNYYGSYGSSYYNSYYSGYSDYYGYNSYYDYSSYYDTDSTTTTTVSTEILPFAPLIFEIYVVADED